MGTWSGAKLRLAEELYRRRKRIEELETELAETKELLRLQKELTAIADRQHQHDKLTIASLKLLLNIYEQDPP